MVAYGTKASVVEEIPSMLPIAGIIPAPWSFCQHQNDGSIVSGVCFCRIAKLY